MLKEIVEKTGVIGACIFVETEIVLSESVPAYLSGNLLSVVGSDIFYMNKTGVSAGLSIRSAFFYFDRYRLLVMPLKKDASLLIICEAQVDCLAMVAAVAMITCDVSEEDLAMATDKNKKEQMEEIVSEAIDSEEMAQLYDQIQMILAEAVGPLSEDIMHYCLQQWKQSGAAVPGRLPELEKMLVEELWDKDLANEFVEKMKKK